VKLDRTAAAVWIRVVSRIVAVAGVLLAVLAVRVVTASRAELADADDRHARNDIEGAIVGYRRAARWYAPANPYSADALAKLERIAMEAERSGNSARALVAFRAMRSAIMTGRSFYVPFRAELAVADRHIAHLVARADRGAQTSAANAARVEREHMALLEADPRPGVVWSFVLLIGFGGWIAGAVGLAIRAIDDEGRIVGREARRWGTVMIAGFGLFVLGLALLP